MTTAQQVNSALHVVRAVADAIRELGSAPSGHLYAQLCGKLSLDDYTAIIRILVKNGLVTESNHLLTWVA